MTAEQWLSVTSPEPMLEFLRGWASERKLRLIGCACRRMVWELLPKDTDRDAVLEVERMVDEVGGLDALKRGEQEPGQLFWSRFFQLYWAPERAHYLLDRFRGATWELMATAAIADDTAAAFEPEEEPSRLAISEILRDIFGNPFSPSIITPSWRTSTVFALATQMYASRDFTLMPMLADALQDAGCPDDSELIRHLQEPGSHCRGCWALDLVLGKS